MSFSTASVISQWCQLVAGDTLTFYGATSLDCQDRSAFFVINVEHQLGLTPHLLNIHVSPNRKMIPGLIAFLELCNCPMSNIVNY